MSNAENNYTSFANHLWLVMGILTNMLNWPFAASSHGIEFKLINDL